jgi:methylmalonyl-CoA mutase
MATRVNMGEQLKLNEFEPADYAAWRKLVERDLAGAAFEKKLVKRISGIDVEPLYTEESGAGAHAGLPGFSPFTRGSFPLGAAEMGWDVRQSIAHASPTRAALAVQGALAGEANSLELVLDGALVRGGDTLAGDGIAITTLAELERVLHEVQIGKLQIALSAGVATIPTVAALAILAEKQTGKASALSGCFGADPVGRLAADGSLPSSLEAALSQASELALWAVGNAPNARALLVNTSAYHEAGADAATEVAVALATGLAYLRSLTAAGLSVDDAAQQLAFEFSVGRDFFVEIAKLRAARTAWAQVVQKCGGGASAQTMVVYARTSRRTKTQRDPWVNLLRGTAESFAAAVGGADAITTAGFDEVLGESDEFGERLARNTQHLLRHESNVHRVVDPAGGSYYVESITEGLAKLAWDKLQGFEKAGGIVQVLTSGSLQAELKKALEGERKAVETRRLAITGVNEFPHVNEEPVSRPHGTAGARVLHDPAVHPVGEGRRVGEAMTLIRKGASLVDVARALYTGHHAQVTPLARERLSQPFEALRDRADAYAQKHGKRPAVFLANLGAIPEHKARAAYAQNFFEAGGLNVLGNDGVPGGDGAAAAFAASGAELVCLCGSDAVYAEQAEATARALKAAGPKGIIYAGSPGEREAALREAGVDEFVFVGVNVSAALEALLARVGAV